jgi:hypothetical protein
MKLIDDVGFDQSFSFIFSSRPGTPAANLADDTPAAEKHERLMRLQAALNANAKKISAAMIGTVQRVLVEKPSTKRPERTDRPHREHALRQFPRPSAPDRPVRRCGDHRSDEPIRCAVDRAGGRNQAPGRTGFMSRSCASGEIYQPTNFDAVWPIFHPAVDCRATRTAIQPDIVSNEARECGPCRPAAVSWPMTMAKLVGCYHAQAQPARPGRSRGQCRLHGRTRGTWPGRRLGMMCEHSMEQARCAGFTEMQFNFVVSTSLPPPVRLWQRHGFQHRRQRAGRVSPCAARTDRCLCDAPHYRQHSMTNGLNQRDFPSIRKTTPGSPICAARSTSTCARSSCAWAWRSTTAASLFQVIGEEGAARAARKCCVRLYQRPKTNR